MKPQKLLILEANIDDMNPQWYEPLIDKLLAAVARDVALIPVIMKKSRPGVIVQALSPGSRRDRLIQILFEESTTIGVRYYPVNRRTLSREVRTVQTPYGRVSVKVARDGSGKVRNISPEHDSCLSAARRNSVPLKTVCQSVLAANRPKGSY